MTFNLETFSHHHEHIANLEVLQSVASSNDDDKWFP